MNRRRFVLLDRDGTLIESHVYLCDPALVQLLPGVADALRRLRRQGLGLAVVTNQAGIGRGMFDLAAYRAVEQRLVDTLAAEGIRLDGMYFCPHHPDDNCDCRKPRAGLVDRAARELHFVPAECFVIGDNQCDVELGRAIGAVTFLVRTGHGLQVEGRVQPDYVCDNLDQAAAIIERLVAAG